eukprot:6492449-Amphidinium_carterae.2
MGSTNGEIDDNNAHSDGLQQPHPDGRDVLHTASAGAAHDRALHRLCHPFLTGTCPQQSNRAMSVFRHCRQMDFSVRLSQDHRVRLRNRASGTVCSQLRRGSRIPVDSPSAPIQGSHRRTTS